VQMPYEWNSDYPHLPEVFFVETASGMIKPYISSFYSLAGYLTPLKALRPGMQLSQNPEVIGMFTLAKIGLILFVSNDWVEKYLPSSFKSAEAISSFIDERVIKLPANGPWDKTLDESMLKGLHSQLKHFDTILHDELGKLPVFLLEDGLLGNLSLDKLLKGARGGYSIEAQKVLSEECKAEIDEAGKCLAHERTTGCGFHILRSVELAIKQYLMAVPGFVMPPLNRQNWGEYIKLLKDNNAAKEVIDTLQAIKENHRNPLMHPHDSLGISEALSLLSVSQAMSELLVSDMKKRGLVT
jgi:hypothetical protein